MLSLPILESTINSTCLPIKSDFLIAHLKISIIWARISCYFINVDPLLKRASFLPLDPHSNYTFMLPFFYAYPSNQGQFISLLFPLRSLPQKPTQDWILLSKLLSTHYTKFNFVLNNKYAQCYLWCSSLIIWTHLQ